MNQNKYTYAVTFNHVGPTGLSKDFSSRFISHNPNLDATAVMAVLRAKKVCPVEDTYIGHKVMVVAKVTSKWSDPEVTYHVLVDYCEDMDDTLENVFRRTQNIGDHSNPCRAASTSVDDIIEVNGVAYRVASFGFSKVEEEIA